MGLFLEIELRVPPGLGRWVLAKSSRLLLELDFGLIVRVRVKGTPRFRPWGSGLEVGVIVRVIIWGCCRVNLEIGRHAFQHAKSEETWLRYHPV